MTTHYVLHGLHGEVLLNEPSDKVASLCARVSVVVRQGVSFRVSQVLWE